MRGVILKTFFAILIFTKKLCRTIPLLVIGGLYRNKQKNIEASPTQPYAK